MARKLLFVVITIAAIAIALFWPRIEQDQRYHLFADDRTILGVRNGLNVLSNLAFVVVGAWGLRVALRGARFSDPRERPAWAALFAGVLLTAAGSAWYHLDPNDASLVWDRLPMSVGFMGLFAALIGERVSVTWGLRLLPPLLALGAASVAWWAWDGNLVPYYVVQFYPLVAILLLLALFPARYARGGDLVIALGLYVAAKEAETYDRAIYQALGFVSGHTLKHLLAAAGAAWLAAMLLRRRSVPPLTA
jgi:hypothetical protein